MAFDLVIRRGDELPKVSKTVYLNGGPVDLTGATATFRVFDFLGAEILNNTAQVAGSTVSYQFTDTDTTAITGENAFAQFVITQAGNQMTVPNNRPLSMLLTNSTSFEYSYSGDPNNRSLDRIRFLLGDTDMTKANFTDSEIEFLVSEFTNPYLAAAEAAMLQFTKYSTLVDKTVGPLSVSYSGIAQRWLQLSSSLSRRASRNSGALAITTQKSSKHLFAIGMHDLHHEEVPTEIFNENCWDDPSLWLVNP